MRLLLISNSGSPLYHWNKRHIADFLGENKEVTFVSAATMASEQEYFQKAQESLAKVGLRLRHLELDKDPEDLIEGSQAFLVGGGNTYHLLKRLTEKGLLKKIATKVQSGTPYVGLSAGAIIATPNILTTNDWNVLGSTSFEGMGLVEFGLNLHYLEPHEKTAFTGETRDERIQEYHVAKDNPVLGVPEKTVLWIEDNRILVKGDGKVKVFRKDQDPQIYLPEEEVIL